MANTPSLLSGCNGKPMPYQAARKVKCSKCEIAICMGENAVIIPMKSGAYSRKRIHCFNCLNKIIEQTRKDLKKIEDMIVIIPAPQKSLTQIEPDNDDDPVALSE